jgi:RsiW-degrading membrane proteinase PrsW (M82 family)
MQETPYWKRVAALTGWLWFLLPVGLWKLWKDPVLTTSAKWRVLIYLVIVPMLAYFAISLSATNTALNRMLP